MKSEATGLVPVGNSPSELRGIHRISLDSSAFIDYMEGGKGANVLGDMFGRLKNKTLLGVTSVTTIPEVIMTARRDTNHEAETAYRNLLGLCEGVAVTEEIAESALMLRANFGLKTADAFHIATALCSRCDAIITNDAKDFGRVQNALPLPHAPERVLRVVVAMNV